MRLPVLVVAALAASLPLSGQCLKPCQAEFDNSTHLDNTSMGNVWLGIKLVAKADLVALRLEVFTGERPGNAALMLFSHDATGNKPATQLARGAFVTGRTKAWQGANLNKPVLLKKGTTFWFVWDTVGGEQSSVAGRGAGAQPYRGSFDQGASWNGPFQSLQWKYRIYCCQKQSATFTTYGKPCTGSNRTFPTIGNTGLPLIGKSYQIDLTRARPNAAAFFALGASDKTYLGLTLPFDLTRFGASGCSVLCSYDVLLGKTTSNLGVASQTIAVPNNTALLGQFVFSQWIVRDPVNTLGLVHSDGGKSTFGT